MSAAPTKQEQIRSVDSRLLLAVDRLRGYQAKSDQRSVWIQRMVIDRLLDERLEAMT